MPTPAARWAAVTSACAFALAIVSAPLGASDDARALWVAREQLTSPQAIDEVAASAKKNGYNTLLVQTRARGDAYYLNGLEPRPTALASQPSFDPLAEALAKGHARGLAVYAWISVNLVAGTDVPAARAHIVYRHPEWLMVPRQIAGDLAALDAAGPEYLGRLTRYARSTAGELEGLYLSPATQSAVDYTTGVVRDIVQRYAIDGVHFDYLRYPNDDFDYSREALRAFGRNPSQEPDRWRQFRADRLTALLSSLRTTVKAARPSAAVSVASPSEPAVASGRHFQDWNVWLHQGLLDVQLGKASFSAQF